MKVAANRLCMALILTLDEIYAFILCDFIKFNTAQNKKSNNPSNHCMVGNIFKTLLLIVLMEHTTKKMFDS